MAGRGKENEDYEDSSVRPYYFNGGSGCWDELVEVAGMDGGEDSDADDEGGGVRIQEDFEGIAGERIALEKEEDIVRKLRDPRLPSDREVEEHYLMGHLPYRSWCGVCVRAKGKDLNHNRDARDERDLSEYSFDYCFPGDELGFKWVVLVGKERGTKTFMATAVPT